MGLGKTLQAISLIACTKADSSPTLIVCPLSLISNWEDQIEQHVVKGVLSVYVHHGATRTHSSAQLAQFNIVITTYNIVQQEHPSGVLFCVPWKRVRMLNFLALPCKIIIDEGHIIKNRRTKQAQAICDLQSTCRWSLTGTPLQNRVDELFPLLKFLRMPILKEFSLWQRHLSRPIKAGDTNAFALIKQLLQVGCHANIIYAFSPYVFEE